MGSSGLPEHGGAIGVSALGAVLANRVTTLMAERSGSAAADGAGTATVPDHG